MSRAKSGAYCWIVWRAAGSFSGLPDRLAGCSGPACKSAQPIAELAKVGQKFSANQLAGIFRIRLYRTPIRLTYASPPPLAYARYGGFASVRLLGESAFP